jgi:hypothetical protein
MFFEQSRNLLEQIELRDVVFVRYTMAPKVGWNPIFISYVKYSHRGVSDAA